MLKNYVGEILKRRKENIILIKYCKTIGKTIYELLFIESTRSKVSLKIIFHVLIFRFHVDTLASMLVFLFIN